MDGSRIIKYVFKKEPLPGYSGVEEEEIDEVRKQSKTVVNAKHSGYVQEIRWNGMVEWARKHDYVIDLHVQIGHFVPQGLPIMSIITTDQSEAKGGGHQFLIVGKIGRASCRERKESDR